MDCIDAATLEALLLNLNFNHPDFIKLSIALLNDKLAGSSSNFEKLEITIAEIEKYKLLNTRYDGFIPAAYGVKYFMLSILNTKLYAIRCLPLDTTEIRTVEQFPIKTDMSVPQIVLLVRLMVETNIISAKSQSALLKMIAAAVHTSKTNNISPESLRVNYYTPNAAAKSIVKTYLLQMVNQLQKH